MSSPWGNFPNPFDDQSIPYHTTQWNPYPPSNYPGITPRAEGFNIEPTNEEDPEEDSEEDAPQGRGGHYEGDEDPNEDEEGDNDEENEEDDEEKEDEEEEEEEENVKMEEETNEERQGNATRRLTIGARISVALVGPTFSFNLGNSPTHRNRSPPRYPDFRSTIRSWREEDEIPSIYEICQSSNGPPIHDLTGEPMDDTLPLFVARGIRTETHLGDMGNALDEMEGYINDLTMRVDVLEGKIAASETNYNQLNNQFGEMKLKWEAHDQKILEQENQNQQRWNTQTVWNQAMEHRILMLKQERLHRRLGWY